ncbi:hypothetical protein NC651_028310 [Populus alba x Populus x berolinensis]|nr:hypothetical protein NC651_028310 [Populus alba x Populus x berolinensis]
MGEFKSKLLDVIFEILKKKVKGCTIKNNNAGIEEHELHTRCLIKCLSYNDGMAARFSIHTQKRNLSTLFQFDATSLPLHDPLVNTSQQIQVPGTDNLLAFDPPRFLFPSSNVAKDEYPYSSTYKPTPSPNYNFGDDASHSSGKDIIRWLELKAALRWGIFVRKKAAERGAQLVS